MDCIEIYLIIINALALVLMQRDKNQAIKHRRRIPEKVLIGTAFIGGSLGILSGMFLFRHKTRHLLFWVVPSILFALQLLTLVLWKLS